MKIQSFSSRANVVLPEIITKSGIVTVLIAFVLFTGKSTYAQSTPNFPETSPNTSNTAVSQWVSFVSESKEQTDVLQWELTNPSNVAYFIIQSSKNSDMAFSEIAIVSPLACIDASKLGAFRYTCADNDHQSDTYYKITAMLKDNRTIESNFIFVRKTSINLASLDISDITDQSGKITLTFKSPKAQNVTLRVLNRNGSILAVQNIVAYEGANSFSFDANYSGTEMLIFSLNNEEEQITKKFLASAW